jgi:hypothetical protein
MGMTNTQTIAIGELTPTGNVLQDKIVEFANAKASKLAADEAYTQKLDQLQAAVNNFASKDAAIKPTFVLPAEVTWPV